MGQTKANPFWLLWLARISRFFKSCLCALVLLTETILCISNDPSKEWASPESNPVDYQEKIEPRPATAVHSRWSWKEPFIRCFWFNSQTTKEVCAKIGLAPAASIIRELEDGWRDTPKSPTINPQGFRRSFRFSGLNPSIKRYLKSNPLSSWPLTRSWLFQFIHIHT